jgi:hypothetical protein
MPVRTDFQNGNAGVQIAKVQRLLREIESQLVQCRSRCEVSVRCVLVFPVPNKKTANELPL